MGGDIGPPEELVFGAKLRCTRALTPSFLFVDEDRKTINGLPAACTADNKPGDNIPAFGTCNSGVFSTSPCTTGIMQLTKEWENPEPQHELINGKEIITTHSFIVCDQFTGMITASDSGQDGKIYAEYIFIRNINITDKYRGLLRTLMDPYSSIYTPVDKHGDVLDLLTDIMNWEGGSIDLMSLDGNSLLGPIVLASIGHLVPSADVGDQAAFLSGMENTISRSRVNNGADAHYLDANMMEVLTKDSKLYAEEVAAGGFYKLQEEHKRLAAYLAEVVTTAAYYAIIYASTSAQYERSPPRNDSCFILGTKILTSVGHVPIECIRTGDYVYSEKVETGEKGLKRVTQTFINETDQLIHIHVDGQKITTTPEHPFYVAKNDWTAAKQLCAGNKLILQSGGEVPVESVQYEITKTPVAVYNLEVEDWHTYYVSDSGLLVHNPCNPGKPDGGYPDKNLRIDKRLINSNEFKDFLESIGENPNKWWYQMETWENSEGVQYERHFWTNGVSSYWHD